MNIKVLDLGYVTLIESWGSDEHVIRAARQSTTGSFNGWDTDGRLLRYLWTHNHMTPFEMAGATFEVQAPLFVFREWHRHRTQSYNELSARYTELPDLFYIPSLERIRQGKQSSTNHQGSEPGLTEDEAQLVLLTITRVSNTSRRAYDHLLSRGLSRELARLVVPVNQYSRMWASANLRNWLAFLTLRMDEAAQWEMRQYATVVHTLLHERFPRTLTLFDEGNRRYDEPQQPTSASSVYPAATRARWKKINDSAKQEGI